MTRDAEPIIESLAGPLPVFERLTYPRFWRRWSQEPGRYLALGCRFQGTAAGLVLVGGPGEREPMTRRVLSVAVAPAFRRRGIGRTLMAEAEAAARARDTDTLIGYHSSRTRGRMALEGLLAACGWEAPAEVEQRLIGAVGWVAKGLEAWRPHLDHIRSRGFAALSWAETDDRDFARIREMLEDPDVAAYTPWPQIEEADHDLSLVLRRDDRPVGWIVAAPDSEMGATYYSGGYVIPALRRSGWLVAGLVEACRRQAEKLGPDSVAAYGTAADNTAMRTFMRRRLDPFGPAWIDIRYVSRKVLS